MWEGFLEEGICEGRPEEGGVGKHVGSGVSSGRVDNQPLMEESMGFPGKAGAYPQGWKLLP